MIVNILAGILGFLFVTIAKMKSLQTDAEKAKMVFVYKEYFKKDAMSMILSFLSIFIWQILFPEISLKYPSLQVFVRCSYFVMGAFGTWVIQAVLSKTKDWIRNNIADNVVKP